MLLYIFYSAFLVSYMILKTGNRFPLRAANKILLAAMYFANGIFLFIQNGSNPELFTVMVALFFAFWGDVLLLFVFKYGGISFSVCGLLFTFFCISNMVRCKASPSFYIIGVAIILVLFSFFGLSERRKWVYIKSGKIFSYIYMVITTLQGAFGLSLALCERTTGTLLLGIGLALFMISDYFLRKEDFFG